MYDETKRRFFYSRDVVFNDAKKNKRMKATGFTIQRKVLMSLQWILIISRTMKLMTLNNGSHKDQEEGENLQTVMVIGYYIRRRPEIGRRSIFKW